MACFDKLSPELKCWINNLHFNIHDDHILKGQKEIERCKAFLDNGGTEHYIPSDKN